MLVELIDNKEIIMDFKIEENLLKAMEIVAKKVVEEQDSVRVIEAQIEEQVVNNSYYYSYEGQRYIGYSINEEDLYFPGDIVQVLVSKNLNIKNYILQHS